MTLLAAALAALLAADPSGSEPPPPSEWGPGVAEPAAPAPPAAPPTAPPLPPMPHSLQHKTLPSPDWMLAAGWGTTSLEGVTATGVEISFETGQPLAAPSRALPLVTLELFVGETAPGLAIASFAAGAELWYDGGRVRGGGGVGAGFVGYRRATSGEWEFDVSGGVRAGIEVAVLRLGTSDVVLGAHGTASFGPWYSGYLALGWRWRGGPP